MMRMPFDSDEARQLNKDIFETIYFGAMEAVNAAVTFTFYGGQQNGFCFRGRM